MFVLSVTLAPSGRHSHTQILFTVCDFLDKYTPSSLSLLSDRMSPMNVIVKIRTQWSAIKPPAADRILVWGKCKTGFNSPRPQRRFTNLTQTKYTSDFWARHWLKSHPLPCQNCQLEKKLPIHTKDSATPHPQGPHRCYGFRASSRKFPGKETSLRVLFWERGLEALVE